MTAITLTPQVETLLHKKAEREGKDVSAAANAILAATLEWEAREFEETVAGIQRGLQAVAEGRERPLADYVADVKRRRQERDLQHEVEAPNHAD